MSVADRLSALSPAQRALFETLLARQAPPAPRALPPVVPRSGPTGVGDWPLSFDQERLWELHREDPGLVSWNVDAGSHVAGNLDLAAFAAAIAELVRRHAAFRTVFPEVGGRPVQRVLPSLPPALSLIDLSALPAGRRERAGHRATYEHTRAPFDLAWGPLLRVALVRLNPREHLYLVTIHHLATDWITFQVFFRELMALYEAPRAHRAGRGLASALPPPPVQFPDFALWERDWWTGETLAAEAAFWRAELAGFPLALDFPSDRPRPAVQSQRGGLYRVAAGGARTDRLRALARREGATTFMAALAAVYALLWRFTGREKLVVGSNSANRPRPELEAVAGFFLTQVPFAGDLAGDPTFRELVGRARRTALAAYAHQSFPVSLLIEALGAPPDRGRHPIVQAVLLILPVELPSRVGDLTFRPVGLYDGNSRWDLMFGLYDDAEAGLLGPLEYNADLFDPPTVGRLLELFYRLLDAAGADPEIRLSQLPAFEEVVRLQVLADLDAGDDSAEPDPEIASRASRLTPALRRIGVVAGAKVGLLLAPSRSRAALALAVRGLGGVPFPLDPGEPAVRLSALLGDADLAVLAHSGPLPAEIAPVGVVVADVTDLSGFAEPS